ncbi:MAG: phosphatase [Leptolyngbyaceae cyanobacterium SL_5_9]|nr:phosphatase [Leptolyngbyaceae cyanobacterium SL_5_9]NJO73595.1 phosphatase [Leptolyngbyaceae cyanobacterium RM1_406_9]
MSRTVLFLCPHNAAKSVIAAAYFERLATQVGLDFQAASAGTEPDAQAASAVVEILKAEGIDTSKHVPRHVTREDLADAFRVVSLGCDVRELAPAGTAIAYWDDVPPPSQNLTAARNSILQHVEQLVGELREAN